MRTGFVVKAEMGGENCLFAKNPLAVPVLISLWICFPAWREGSCSVAFRPEATRLSQREVGHSHQANQPWFLCCFSRVFHLWARSVHSEASEIMHDIGTAIEYLHHLDIAHRDVKVVCFTKKNLAFQLNASFKMGHCLVHYSLKTCCIPPRTVTPL